VNFEFFITDDLKRLYIQLSGIDYVLYRFTKAFTEAHPFYAGEISAFYSEVGQWRLKLAEVAPVLKWDWDDDGYLVYVPYEDSKSVQLRPCILDGISMLIIYIYI
jgi:hypothetical protein